jgi:hypothetical protein
MVTIFWNIHELDCDFLLLLFMSAKHNLPESTLSQLSDDLIVIKYRTEIKVLSYK